MLDSVTFIGKIRIRPNVKIKESLSVAAVLAASTFSASAAPSAEQAAALFRDYCLELRHDGLAFVESVERIGVPLQGREIKDFEGTDAGTGWRIGADYVVYRTRYGNCRVYVLEEKSSAVVKAKAMNKHFRRVATDAPSSVRVELSNKGKPNETIVWTSVKDPSAIGSVMSLRPTKGAFYEPPQATWILSVAMYFGNNVPVVDVPAPKVSPRPPLK